MPKYSKINSAIFNLIHLAHRAPIRVAGNTIIKDLKIPQNSDIRRALCIKGTQRYTPDRDALTVTEFKIYEYHVVDNINYVVMDEVARRDFGDFTNRWEVAYSMTKTEFLRYFKPI